MGQREGHLEAPGRVIWLLGHSAGSPSPSGQTQIFFTLPSLSSPSQLPCSLSSLLLPSPLPLPSSWQQWALGCPGGCPAWLLFPQILQKPSHDLKQQLAGYSKRVAGSVTELIQAAEAMKGRRGGLRLPSRVSRQPISAFLGLLTPLSGGSIQQAALALGGGRPTQACGVNAVGLKKRTELFRKGSFHERRAGSQSIVRAKPGAALDLHAFLSPAGTEWVDPEDPTVIAENELLGAAAAIEAAAKKLEQLKPRAKPKVGSPPPAQHESHCQLSSAPSVPPQCEKEGPAPLTALGL